MSHVQTPPDAYLIPICLENKYMLKREYRLFVMTAQLHNRIIQNELSTCTACHVTLLQNITFESLWGSSFFFLIQFKYQDGSISGLDRAGLPAPQPIRKEANMSTRHQKYIKQIQYYYILLLHLGLIILNNNETPTLVQSQRDPVRRGGAKHCTAL